MPKRVPIAAARRVAAELGLSQVMLVGWDGERAHVVTWGKTLRDCEQVAVLGEVVQQALGFPPDLCAPKPRCQHRRKKGKEQDPALVVDNADVYGTFGGGRG